MAGETIENVIFRLSLQIAESKLKAPDVSQATAAIKTVEDAIARATARMDSSFEGVVTRIDQVNKEMTQLGDATLKVQTDSFSKAEDRATKSFDEIQSKIDEANSHLDRAAAKRERQEEDAISRQERTIVTSRRVGVSFRQTAEGAAQLGRGVALLAASFDDDLAKAVQTYLLPAQAAFDITKGLANIFSTFGARAAPWLAAIGTGVALLASLKKANDDFAESEKRAMDLQDQHIEILKKREEAQKKVLEAHRQLAAEQRGRAQGEASQLLNLQFEAIRTLDPEQRRAALQNVDTGALVGPRAEQGIELLRRGGDVGGANQIAQDRVEQLQNELSRLRELLATEREIAAEQKQQLLRGRGRLFDRAEDEGFVDPNFRLEFGRETERLTENLEKELQQREKALNAAMTNILTLAIKATAQAQELQRQAETAAVSAD